ncbi:hyoothetical protein [Trichoderma reesei QM6a]|jgi:SAM-dependent methyltransferase|uniref:Hyoothetical protein n=2 Tax=Hypocrea jecorina TaxID=51453 RepID=G0R8H5_HYPJQ|nr:hyoothetical protein [Trichoderma reesei QM6a]EGR52881.1 hyoothetical protein [Trichoderma reesei QM6a]ETS06678.1 kinase domain-containing protein [Trichoderma reesei RUT C-30]
MPADFDQQAYWHRRFSTESSFEWLLSSNDFIAILNPLLNTLDRTSTRILNIGCGTSDLHNHFRRLGFSDVTNIDYEPLALERGQQLERQAFGDVRMKYAVADATKSLVLNPSSSNQNDSSETRNEKFNLVVDKSTVDAISCGGEEQVRRMAHCVRECLADDDDDAVWVSLSYSAARFELEGLPFDVEVLERVLTAKRAVADPDIYHWCYLLRPR